MAASSQQRAPLAGRRIFVVEDEYFLADDIGAAFRAMGAEVAGPIGHYEDALKVLEDGGVLDAAVLDVNIRSEMIFPIARELKARNVPFVFTTGYDRITLGAEFQGVPLLEKPIDLSAMAYKLAGLIAKREILPRKSDHPTSAQRLRDELWEARDTPSRQGKQKSGQDKPIGRRER